MTPYYEDDFATIYHGDCFDMLPRVGLFDLGFADPPYNYGIDYGHGFEDLLPPAAYVSWCDRWFWLLRDRVDRLFITPGHGNMLQWLDRYPAGVGCWYKPGNPSGASIFQFCEWEPVMVWGVGRIGGSNVWKATINPEFKGPTGHPCPKPELLLRRMILAAKARTVLDPFMGSGTTLVAAKAMNVRATGIERNERYCEIAAKRLAQEVLDFGGAA